MVLFWGCAALLTAAVVLALTRSLVSGVRADQSLPDANTADIAVYRQQLIEIENDTNRGLLTGTEAEAARIEISRRLLEKVEPAAALAPTTLSVPERSVRSGAERLFTAIACAVPVVALGLYLALGSPGSPGRPIAERLARAPTAAADIDELVGRVEARLRTNPSDGQGWDVIAPVYLRLERFTDAADAYRRALDLQGETAPRLAGLAESTVLANDGIVTEVARKAYARLLELDPDRTEARFGLALAKEQDGALEEAEADYYKLIEEAPIGAPWRRFIGERIDAIAARRSQSEPKPAQPRPGQPRPGPSQVEAITALPDPDRRQVILQMVEGLALKLKADGRDADGWQRLIRSWTVLGETPKAEAALAEERKALVGDIKALAEIDAFAKSLGLKS